MIFQTMNSSTSNTEIACLLDGVGLEGLWVLNDSLIHHLTRTCILTRYAPTLYRYRSICSNAYARKIKDLKNFQNDVSGV